MPLPTVGLALCLSFPSLTRAGDSASEALRSLAESVGQTALANVVAVSGFDGQHQPAEWRILVRDAASDAFLHEFLVKNGQAFGPTRLAHPSPVRLPARPLFPAQALPVDSSRVFELCDQLAASAGIGFDRLTYQLEWRGSDLHPTWLASLIDERRNLIVGHIFVSAVDGLVLHRRFFPPAPGPRNLRAVTGSSVPSPERSAKNAAFPLQPTLPSHRYGAKLAP